MKFLINYDFIFKYISEKINFANDLSRYLDYIKNILEIENNIIFSKSTFQLFIIIIIK